MQQEKRFRWLMSAMFAASAAVTVAEGVAYRQTTVAYTRSVHEADAITARLRTTRRLYADLLDAEAGQRGYLLTGKAAYLVPFHATVARLDGDLSAFRAGQPEARAAAVAEIDRTLNTQFAEMRETIHRYDRYGPGAARHIVRADAGRQTIDRARGLLDGFVAEDEQQRAAVHVRMAAAAENSARNWTVGSAVVLLGMFGGFIGLWRLSRRNAHLAARLLHEARHDGLTGLPNRTAFRETLDYVLAVAKRGRQRAVVLYLDLDGFKRLNDELGHAAGDVGLVEVARMLRRVLRASDFVARLGGDEFAVLVPAAYSACNLCDRIERAIETLAPPALGGLRLGTSIGVAVFPDDGETADELLAVADQRMYEHKQRAAAASGTADHRCRVCRGDAAGDGIVHRLQPTMTSTGA